MRSVIDSFLRIAHNTTCRRCPFAHPPRQYTRSAHLPRAGASVRRRQPRTPRRQPRLLAHASAARARRPGLERAPIKRAVQSRETHPRAGKLVSGLPQPSWAAMAGFELAAVYWPSVPTSPGGRQPTPKVRAALAPGGPKLEMQHARPTSWQARWQLMRHSGRRTRSHKCTGHCPGSGRPLGSINQTQSPHVH